MNYFAEWSDESYDLAESSLVGFIDELELFETDSWDCE